uniref:Uncharacterized protein n=1 Tax=Oryza brachyantha TaxID=4533 RepID=J3NBF6_ORYBR
MVLKILSVHLKIPWTNSARCIRNTGMPSLSQNSEYMCTNLILPAGKKIHNRYSFTQILTLLDKRAVSMRSILLEQV